MPRLSELRPAYEEQQAALVSWLEQLPPEDWERPSTLAGWTVRDLAYHVTAQTVVVVAAVDGGPVSDAPFTVARYISAFAAAADEIADRDRHRAAELGRDGILANAEHARTELLAALAGVLGDPVVMGRRGPIKVSDLMVTRINELVVHSADLSASLPDRGPAPLERQALGQACRMLAGVLAERAPGHTVEVRVPPFAAVQCVEGPRHTRGTPANVVEVDPALWVMLATGRTTWAAALSTGKLTASGERSDISAYLPVL
jgi:uncharacterized protein (TIGR03083 family)